MAGFEINVIFVNGNPSAGSISVSGNGYCDTTDNVNVLTDNRVTAGSRNVCTVTPNSGFTFTHVVAESDKGSVTLTPGQYKSIDELSVGGNLTITIYFKSDGYTSNYQLKKPATTDYVTIGDINDNMDKIDAQMKANADAIASKAGTSVATQSANGLMSSADKTKLDGVDSALAGKVSKSGDTMTGNLTIEKSWIPLTTLRVTSASLTTPASSVRDLGYTFEDSRGYQIGSMYERLGTDGGLYLALQTKSDKSGSTVNSSIIIHNNADGTKYATAPSWSVGTNDNSDKILTIKMANSLPSLVHTTGNETIAGSKRFSQGLIRQHSAISAGSVPTSDQYIPVINIQDSSGTDFGYIRMFAGANSKLRLLQIEVNKLNDDGSTPENSFLQLFAEDENGPARATAPTTPSGATGAEIATANWVIARINELATKNKLIGL